MVGQVIKFNQDEITVKDIIAQLTSVDPDTVATLMFTIVYKDSSEGLEVNYNTDCSVADLAYSIAHTNKIFQEEILL